LAPNSGGARKEWQMTSGPVEVMSIDELAEYLKISRSTLYKLAQEGGLPGQKVGRRWRFHKGAIDDWLRQHPEHLDEKREARL
jgi:excisionase family DNA binding protein